LKKQALKNIRIELLFRKELVLQLLMRRPLWTSIPLFLGHETCLHALWDFTHTKKLRTVILH